MGVQRLTERVSTSALSGGVGDIDEAAGLIRNAGLCGLVSENGNDYPLAMQQRDHVKYEGAKVYFDHTDERTGRKFRDWVGVVRRPSCVASGSRGELDLFKSDPNVPKLLEALRKCPEKFGMSHVAQCKTRRENGRNVVEGIEAVESVDIVLNPATNPKGFFRHESKGAAVAQISLKTFGERFGPKWGPAKWGAFATLCEAIGDVADAPVMDEPAADAPEGGDLKTALMAAITPMLDEAFESGDGTKVCAALKDFIKLHAKHTGKGDGKPADDKPADDDAAEEAKKRPKTYAGYIAEAKSFGLKAPTADDVTFLEGAPTQAGRRAYCERVAGMLAEADRPRSGGRPPGSGPAPDAKKTGPDGRPLTESVPTEAKAFAASIRE
jgi:hypothetical protein